MHLYQKTIHKIDPSLNPAGVHASMILQHSTLDHLPHHTFVEETAIAGACEEADPGYLKGIAESYGMSDDYREWETILAQEAQQNG